MWHALHGVQLLQKGGLVFFSNGRRRLKVGKKMELGEEGSQVLSDSSSILSGLELNCFELIWFVLHWFELFSFELIWFVWFELDMTELIWIDLIWFEYDWFDLNWFDLHWIDLIYFAWMSYYIITLAIFNVRLDFRFLLAIHQTFKNPWWSYLARATFSPWKRMIKVKVCSMNPDNSPRNDWSALKMSENVSHLSIFTLW